MTMPNLTGDRLAEEIKAIRQDVPIILCTGFNEQLNGRRSSDTAIQSLIMKPIGMNTLAKTIREVIDRHQRERRKDQRFRLKEGVFVISKTNSGKQGRVIDISRSGLSFQYARNGDRPKQFDHLSIRTIDKSFNLDDINYETISDIAAADDAESMPETVRRRGGRFSSLTPLQHEQLVHFLKTCTTGMPT
jgi:YesN/AraC family two-component response regulator